MGCRCGGLGVRRGTSGIGQPSDGFGSGGKGNVQIMGFMGRVVRGVTYISDGFVRIGGTLQIVVWCGEDSAEVVSDIYAAHWVHLGEGENGWESGICQLMTGLLEGVNTYEISERGLSGSYHVLSMMCSYSSSSLTGIGM